jgi:hypothetical protein
MVSPVGDQVLLDVITNIIRQIEPKSLRTDKRVLSCIEISVRLALAYPKGFPLRPSRVRQAYRLTKDEWRSILQAMATVGTFTTYYKLG